MEQSLFYQLSSIMVLAAIVSLIFKALKQPMIIGYIITGFLVGPTFLDITADHDILASFSEIGIVLLLFMIGLGINAAVIKSTGKPVLVTFLLITVGVGAISYGAGAILGFSMQECLIVAVALLFSSTIIVVKALSDRKEQSRLYSQLAIGILLVEDVAATVALLWVSTSTGGSVTLGDFWLLIVKGMVLGGSLALIGMYLMPRFSKLFAESQELLYILALAWGFGVASLFQLSGFSIEVGALFAGVAMAHLPYAQEISNRLKPLRDFFVLLFFIELGSRMGINNLQAALVPALIFSAIILITKPLIIIASLGALGYTKQTAFRAAVHLSQISEFSIILVVLAQKTDTIRPEITAMVTLTALITIIVSAYLMNYDHKLYRLFEKQLSVFERAETKKEVRALEHYPLVLIGYQNGGHDFVRTFRAMKKRYVVIDYNPGIIEVLQHQHIVHIYGDSTDTELLDEIGVHRSELIISNITSLETNSLLLSHISSHNTDSVFICHASTYEDAQALYEKGATYVMMPHLIGTEHLNSFIRHNGSNKAAYEKHRKHQLRQLSKALLAA
ncbi:MAG TPA: cation:proton antiporter [Candidatus Saccharimonadia bacterium]